MRKTSKKSKRKAATLSKKSLPGEVKKFALFLREKVHATEKKAPPVKKGLSPAHTVERVAQMMRKAIKKRKKASK